MGLDLSVYLTILGAASVVLLVLARISPMRQWFMAACENKFWFLVTCAMWGLLTWPVGVDLYTSTSEIGTLRLVRVCFFIVLFIFLVFYLITRRSIRRTPSAALLAYLGYTAVCFLSARYSPDPVQTLWKSFELLVCVLFAYVILHQITARPYEAAGLVYGSAFLLFVLSVFSLVGGFLYPDIAYGIPDFEEVVNLNTGSMGGILPRINANSLGQIGGMVACFGLIELFGRGNRRIPGALILIVGGFLTLVAAHGRTSLLAFVVIVPAILLILRRFSALVFSLAIVVGAAPLAATLVFDFFARGQGSDLLYSMSGRTYVWTIGLESFYNHPLLGLGFYAGHKSLDLSGILTEHSTLDNTYLESLVNVGLLGTLFLVLFAATVLRSLGSLLARFRNGAPDELKATLFIFVMVGFVLIRSFTGPSYQIWHFNLSIMLVCAVCLAVFDQRSCALESLGVSARRDVHLRR